MIEGWQIFLITLYAFIQPTDQSSFNLGMSMPIFAGWFTGMVLGNPETGLFIGGSLTLMTLGVATYGGTSIPDTVVGAIVGTALALNTTPELALSIAIPVALFMIQLDILRRYVTIYYQHRADKYVAERKYDLAMRQNIWGIFPKALSRAIPVLLVLILGPQFIDQVLAAVPAWLVNGLKVSGGIIPVVGIGILLSYLPTAQKYMFLILGFLLVAYLKLPMLAVAGIGLVVAGADYMYAVRLDQKLGVARNVGGEVDE